MKFLNSFKSFTFVLLFFAFFVLPNKVLADGTCAIKCSAQTNKTAFDQCLSKCEENMNCTEVQNEYGNDFLECSKYKDKNNLTDCFKRVESKYNQKLAEITKKYDGCTGKGGTCYNVTGGYDGCLKACYGNGLRPEDYTTCYSNQKEKIYITALRDIDCDNNCSDYTSQSQAYNECIKWCESSSEAEDEQTCNDFDQSYAAEIYSCGDTYKIKADLDRCFANIDKKYSSDSGKSLIERTCYWNYRDERYDYYVGEIRKPDVSDTPSNPDYELNYDPNSSPCENENIGNAVKVFGKVVSIIQIAAPIILVVMAMVDLMKSIISEDDSKNRKNMNLLVKRVLSAVIIFFVIAIVKLVCGLANNDSVDSTCLGYISNPWK